MEINVYDCEHFQEPVLKQAGPRNTDRIRGHVPGYNGRQCKTCEVFLSEKPAEQGADMEVKITAGGREVGRRIARPTDGDSGYRNPNVAKPLPETGLVSPADHKIVQLEITNRCFLNCSNCTRLVGHQSQPYEMDRETFRRAVESVADHPGMIGIMGGEPTLHADFDTLVRDFATVIDAGCKYERLRQPVADLAAYRTRHCSSLHHRRGLWSATGPKFLQHLELISEVFGYWCLNDHRHQGKHQALLMARQDLGIPADQWRAMRDRCWVQRTWSSSVNPAGAYFCEVAAAIDWTLFGGRHAWPIEAGWWKRTPADFGEQLSLCEYCAAPVNVPARLPAENRDDVTPRVYELLAAAGSPRVARGHVVVHGNGTDGTQGNHDSHASHCSHDGSPIAASTFGIESYMAQPDGQIDNDVRIAADNPWIRPREIVGVVVCVDCCDWLADVLRCNSPQLDRTVVVTTPDDQRTQAIALEAGVDLVVSDVCHKGGDAFNKGRMLNVGLAALQPRDWVLFFDADVLLPPNWGQWLRARVLNPGVLYYARRLHALDDGQWSAALADWGSVQQLKIRDRAADLLPFGYHQLWNARAAAIAGRAPLVSEVFPTAAAVDFHWYRLWEESKRVRLPDELSIVHHWHGPFASRWHNRGVADGGWEWVGQVSPVGPLWFLQGKEPQWPAQVKLIDMDTERSELVAVRDLRRLKALIGERTVDVYVRGTPPPAG
jgi:hypothetical protein